jgi:hypothetical protein
MFDPLFFVLSIMYRYQVFCFIVRATLIYSSRFVILIRYLIQDWNSIVHY